MKVSAKLESASLVAEAVRQHCRQFGEPRVCFCCELLLREAITNAAVHGSKGEEGGEILCVVRRKRGRLLIWVQDEGPGFDWRSVLLRESDPSIPGGRGMEIYRRYATQVRFNQKGNGVVLIRRFEKE